MLYGTTNIQRITHEWTWRSINQNLGPTAYSLPINHMNICSFYAFDFVIYNNIIYEV
jgi:hypothetical protein